MVTDQDQLEGLPRTWKGASWIPESAATIALIIPEAEGREAPRDRFDLGQASMQITIAATGLGIGSGQATYHDQVLAREILGFPEGKQCPVLIALGHHTDRPLRPIKNALRRNIQDVAHQGSW